MAADVDDILDDLIGRVRRVRNWLVALGALKTAAIGLACVCLYIGLYAWLDHHAHLGHAGRLAALLVLILLLAGLSYSLLRALRRNMSYAYAAGYVESRRSFDQQLVAAVEYFERRDDYPYSKTLARLLVLQVDDAARGFRFDSTIDKWRGYVLAGLIVLGLSVVGLFVQKNVLYFSSYLSRLVRPLATIEPASATVLESVTEDIVAAVDAPVTFTASVRGRPPESATLVLTRLMPAEANEAGEFSERIEVRPTVDPQGNVTFSATKQFDAPGQMTYRFEADGAASDVHTIQVCEPPAIESMTATVSAGGASPYVEQVKDSTLEVLPGSDVELQVRSTTPLREAVVVTPDGETSVQKLDGADSFSLQLSPDEDSTVELKLVSTDGIAGSEPTKLHVAIKTDKPPQLKLLCPEGDCLATDVASIPIAFEVTDEFGLDSAQLFCELPDRVPILIDSNEVQGARTAVLTHTLELEQYDLHVGDSVLFYARAKDVDTGQRTTDAGSCSEVYFIEIRPYRQYWHPQPGGSEPSSMPGPTPEDLITILEYTRAILKKTWALAHKPQTTDSRSQIDALRGDVDHCATGLVRTRDDPEAGFTDADKAALNEVLDRYTAAGDAFGRADATAALPAVRDAYHLLRQFIDELHLKWTPPQTGQSIPEDKPERIRLQEEPKPAEMDEQRVENQLEKTQRKIESLAREQKSLASSLKKAMQQASSSDSSQSSDSSSSSSGGQPSASGSPSGQSTDQSEQTTAKSSAPKGNPSDKQAGGAPPSVESRQTADARKGDTAASQGEQGNKPQTAGGRPGKSSPASNQTPSQSAGQGSSPGSVKGSSSPTDARLRMLEAKQKALREQASQMRADLEQLLTSELSAQGRARDEAKQHLEQAVAKMKEFEDRLIDARYESPMQQEGEPGMSEPAESAGRQLVEAGRAIRRGLSADKAQSAAEQAQEMAEQLAEDAEALDESLSPAERQRMLDRLEAAKRAMESLGGPQWATISEGGSPDGRLVYTKGASMTPAQTARMLAQLFWSLAIEARRKELQPFAEEPSDVQFFQAEKEFFKKAARFKR